MSNTLMKFTSKPIFKWAAYRALVGRNRSPHEPEKGRFTRAEVRHILDQLWHNYDELSPDIPREPTRGSRMNMELACMTLSFHRALLAAGIERDYAISLIADFAWVIYQKWGILPRLISRLRTRDPVKRMRICLNLFLRFPFNPPGYIFQRLPADDGISFDMRRCPIAEYFQSYEAADVCVGSWCNLDYPLAEMWGGWLERAGTLVEGDDCCSFRFKALPKGKKVKNKQ
jgi:ubiquinone biosynthesis protein